jgi:hypothetical protein
MFHETRQSSQAYYQRVTRLMQPLIARRHGARAASEVLRALDRMTEHSRVASLTRTPDDFRTEMELAIEAIDESVFWLELLRLTEPSPPAPLDSLIAEGQELAALYTSATMAGPRTGAGSGAGQKQA